MALLRTFITYTPMFSNKKVKRNQDLKTEAEKEKYLTRMKKLYPDCEVL